jgi:hypothetical protein
MDATRQLTFDEQLDQSDRKAYLEQLLFVFSPIGALPTTLVLFAVLMGSYAVLALVSGVPLISDAAGHIAIDRAFRVAVSLIVVLCTALFVQRFVRLRQRADKDAIASILLHGERTAVQLLDLTPRSARLFPATLLGVALGAVVSWLLFVRDTEMGWRAAPALCVWFVIVTTILAMAFTRGIELTRTGSHESGKIIDHELIIDLLRIDRLSIWGRMVAGYALTWFCVSAATCLFFLGDGLTGFTIGMLVTFLIVGMFNFFAPMARVHFRIRAKKAAELERLRSEIDRLRGRALGDPGAATQLQGVLAYEARIAAAPEWPYDQSTLVRLGASAMILAVPWFGREIGAHLIQKFWHFSG